MSQVYVIKNWSGCIAAHNVHFLNCVLRKDIFVAANQLVRQPGRSGNLIDYLSPSQANEGSQSLQQFNISAFFWFYISIFEQFPPPEYIHVFRGDYPKCVQESATIKLNEAISRQSGVINIDPAGTVIDNGDINDRLHSEEKMTVILDVIEEQLN